MIEGREGEKGKREGKEGREGGNGRERREEINKGTDKKDETENGCQLPFQDPLYSLH